MVKDFPFHFSKLVSRFRPGILFLVSILFLYSCAKGYNTIIRDTEKLYYSGNYDAAIPKIRELATNADSKDKLLYLMEAGIIFHTQGNYESSNKAFKEAEEIADTIKVSIAKSGLSFVLSDNESNFTGEDFERVLIKFYIALNYIFLGQLEDAKIYFRRLDIELREMKYVQAKYKQNLCARYLDAILSESLNRYNDARVQYRNLVEIAPELEQVKGDRLVLAIKENDSRDIGQLSSYKNLINSYDQKMRAVPYEPGMGEVVIIHQAGKAATKESRGKLLNDQYFLLTLRGAIEGAIRSQNQAGLSVAGVMASISTAENPIPVYKMRDPAAALPRPVLVNGKNIGTTVIYNDYSDTAIKNFNDNYTSMVVKNVSSIAIKLVAAAAATEAFAQSLKRGGKKSSEQQLVEGVLRLGVGAAAGFAAGATISPDLRSWRLLPSNYQIKRIHLKPGKYTIELPGSNLPDGKSKTEVLVESGRPTFLNYRSFNPE